MARILGPEPPGPGGRYSPREVLSLETPDGPGTGTSTAPLFLPSAELLDRARVGWEGFLATFGEAPDE